MNKWGGIKGTLPFNYMMTCKADKSRLCRNWKRPHYPHSIEVLKKAQGVGVTTEEQLEFGGQPGGV
jgi:hypothetical protein